MIDSLLAKLAERCPTLALTRDPEELAQFGRDWTKVHTPAPSLVAFPRTREEVQALLALCNELGIADQVRINPVSSEFFSREFYAPRPDSERLINRKLHLRGLNSMSDWRSALKAYVDRDYRHYL